MGEHPNSRADRRQVFKTREGNLRQVPDTVYGDDDLRRPGLGQFTIQESNHVEL